MADETITWEIERPVSTVFRRAYIKRRQSSDGKYESSWQDITPYIKNWGQFEVSVDDVRVNRFTFSGLTIVARNDAGKFNPETNANSLWNGYLSRYRTLLKIEAGYEQDNGTEVPTDPSQGIFLLDGEIIIDSLTNEATLECRPISSIFEEVQANEVDGIYTTMTASDILAKIRDHTDGSSNFVFRELITSTAWAITTTTYYYHLQTATAIESMTVWDLMEKLAEAENFLLTVTRTGGIIFKSRAANTTTSQFDLKGEGYAYPTIISLNWHKEAIDKFYDRVRLKYLAPETSTSYVSTGTETAVSPTNVAWKYGSKTYTFENSFIHNTATAQTITAALYNELSDIKLEVEVTCRFMPHLDISDRVHLFYTQIDLNQSRLWDTEDWASDGALDASRNDGLSWDPELGENFDFVNTPFKILSRRTDLEQFTTTLALRAI